MTTYCASSEVLTASLNGRTVLLNLRSHRCFGLNTTAAAIWDGLERCESEGALVDGLCRHFVVSPEEAGTCLTRFLGELASRELIQAASFRGFQK